MSNTKSVESKGRCDWCFTPGKNIRLCRINTNFGPEICWLEPLWVCDGCRKVLLRRYEYIKPEFVKSELPQKEWDL